MPLALGPPLEPMLAKAAADIPRGGSWVYEPKWDGFRAIIFRDGDSDLRTQPFDVRRRHLLDVVRVDRTVGITPQTSSPDEAAQWFQRYEGAGLDGVVAKDPAGVYLHGERRWVKVKHLRTVDCVV